MKNKKKFMIFDGNAILHRAWHALPPMTSKGRMVNAVYGFVSIFLKALKEFSPEFIAVAFDRKEKTFRHEEFVEYKAKRIKQPDEFYAQIPIVKEILQAFNIKIFEKAGFEADDVIGTLCEKRQVNRDDVLSIIVTGDMDALQLVDDNTEVYTLRKGMSDTVIYNEKAVREKFEGLGPEQMIDYKGLRGDASDNIPGVPGIGEKTALQLLKEFGTIDNLYKKMKVGEFENVKITERLFKILTENKEQALKCRYLATIVRDVKLDFKLEDCERAPFDKLKVTELFADLEFKSLLNRLPLQRAVENVETEHVPSQKDGQKYHLIDTEEKFAEFFEKIRPQKQFCFDTETTSLNVFQAELLGVSFCWRAGEAAYVLNKKDWVKQLKPFLENEEIKKIGHNIKYDMEILKLCCDIDVRGLYFDTMIASYLLNPGSRVNKLDLVVFRELKYEKIPIKALIGEGKQQLTMDLVSPTKVSEYSCEDADYTFRLVEKLEPQLRENNLWKVFEEIEMPLILVLAEIEMNGIMIDSEYLNELAGKLQKRVKAIEKKVYELAGKEFNIASPLQLKEILFEKLGIAQKGLKKNKTGVSTAANELEKMQGQHEIIDYIIEFRGLSKLLSTYLEALPKLVEKKTGRVHTSFNQTITATGRLSSSDPNLQNIPVKTELGREIRRAFIAPRGRRLISADYSQVELRVIACLAKDETMMDVFKRGEDIHRATAAKIFNVPLEKVTDDQRRAAKEVNFGVIYGMGVHGLATRKKISRQQAKDFIDKYFENFHKVKEYLETMKEFAAAKGYVETMFGRRRYLPEMHSGVQQVRAGAERMAINHPIQGTGADLLKIAMIEVFKELKKKSPATKMVLTVHDELVFEVDKDEVQKVGKVIDEKMEKIHKLCVPLNVDTKVGQNWRDMIKEF
ncbi:MAG: DNA polymerase I [Candidatus Falkowbacteria bacterium]